MLKARENVVLVLQCSLEMIKFCGCCVLYFKVSMDYRASIRRLAEVDLIRPSSSNTRFVLSRHLNPNIAELPVCGAKRHLIVVALNNSIRFGCFAMHV